MPLSLNNIIKDRAQPDNNVRSRRTENFCIAIYIIIIRGTIIIKQFQPLPKPPLYHTP
jgi:hypothetical protein